MSVNSFMLNANCREISIFHHVTFATAGLLPALFENVCDQQHNGDTGERTCALPTPKSRRFVYSINSTFFYSASVNGHDLKKKRFLYLYLYFLKCKCTSCCPVFLYGNRLCLVQSYPRLDTQRCVLR